MGWSTIDEAPVLPDGSVELDERDVIDADDDVVVQEAKALPAPRVPTQTEIDAHNVTHMPYRSWCKWCVMARRPNSHHRRHPVSNRSCPLRVADYCFMGDSSDEEMCLTLVAKLYPAKALLAVVCDQKGVDDQVVGRLSIQASCRLLTDQIKSLQLGPC